MKLLHESEADTIELNCKTALKLLLHPTTANETEKVQLQWAVERVCIPDSVGSGQAGAEMALGSRVH
jgi:hypothetical protein